MIIFFDKSSFKIFGKKKEKNKVMRKRKTYWIPRKELTVARKATGAKNMAKLCKKLASPPENCALKKIAWVFLSKIIFLAKISFLDFLLIRKTSENKKTKSIIQTIP